MLDLIIWELGGLIGEKSPKSPNQNRVGGGWMQSIQSCCSNIAQQLGVMSMLEYFSLHPKTYYKRLFWLLIIQSCVGWLDQESSVQKKRYRTKKEKVDF